MFDAAEPRRLQSYLSGDWRSGEGDGKPLLNAGTGDVVAHIGSDGLDFQGAVEWVRDHSGFVDFENCVGARARIAIHACLRQPADQQHYVSGRVGGFEEPLSGAAFGHSCS